MWTRSGASSCITTSHAPGDTVGLHLRHMAHKAKTGISVEYRPRVILERPQLAALLGAVAAEWSRLGHDVTFLYANLMGGYLPTLEGFVPPLHPVALRVFDTLETQYHRLQLLEKLAKWVVRDESLLSDLVDTVISAIRSAAKLRNTLVHANWGIAGEYPDGLINNPIFGTISYIKLTISTRRLSGLLQHPKQHGNSV